MQPDTSFIPHSFIQILSLVLASSLGWIGGWLTRRKREPAEIRRIDAEVRQINVSTDVSLLQAASQAIEKAEALRDSFHQREEQLRNQMLFWREKAEGLDGELIDSRNANGLLHARLKNKTDSLDKAMALLKLHGISYAEIDAPKPRD